MKRWSVRQLSILLLAAFVAAGMGLSVAQASAMTAKMATMSDMAMSDHGDCQDCPDQPGAKGVKAMACGNVCAVPVVAPLPGVPPVPVGQTIACEPVRGAILVGTAWPPEPDPPRTSDIA